MSDSLRFTLGGDVLLDVSGTSTGVFEYDPSGNLVKDGLNRLEFSYNCLNLMQTVQTTVGASKAQFTYGSDGRKLSEKARTGGFEYLGSLIYAYRGGLSLAQAVTDEGTIQSAGVNYFIRDHLGSVRAVVDHTGKIVERNDYYPFGDGMKTRPCLFRRRIATSSAARKRSNRSASICSTSARGSTIRGSLAGIRRTRWAERLLAFTL